MARGNVEQIGGEAQEKVISLKAQGLSAQAIADEINKYYRAHLTSKDISNYLARKSKESFRVLKEEKGFQEKLAKQYFDTISQVQELNQEMWKFFYEIRKDPEFVSKSVNCPDCNHKFSVQMKTFGTLLKAADHLLSQIKHVDEVLGRMQNKSLNITYNYVDLSKKLTQVMPQLLQRAERMGAIKINKRRLTKVCEK